MMNEKTVSNAKKVLRWGGISVGVLLTIAVAVAVVIMLLLGFILLSFGGDNLTEEQEALLTAEINTELNKYEEALSEYVEKSSISLQSIYSKELSDGWDWKDEALKGYYEATTKSGKEITVGYAMYINDNGDAEMYYCHLDVAERFYDLEGHKEAYDESEAEWLNAIASVYFGAELDIYGDMYVAYQKALATYELHNEDILSPSNRFDASEPVKYGFSVSVEYNKGYDYSTKEDGPDYTYVSIYFDDKRAKL